VKIGELVEGQVFHTRLTGRTGRVVEIHPVSGVFVVWTDKDIGTYVHHDIIVDPVGFVRPK
jgi:hypothetical protein